VPQSADIPLKIATPAVGGTNTLASAICGPATDAFPKTRAVTGASNIKGVHTYYSLYLAVRDAHAEAPDVWTVDHCKRLLTSIMSAKPFAWRVVGVTQAALKKFHELDYRYRSKQGLTRAHLRPRIETVRELLDRSEPMSQDEFIEYWLTHDRTILCAQGENKVTVPDFIEFENRDGVLFSSNQVAWRHGRAERDLLQRLYEEFIGAVPQSNLAMVRADPP